MWADIILTPSLFLPLLITISNFTLALHQILLAQAAIKSFNSIQLTSLDFHNVYVCVCTCTHVCVFTGASEKRNFISPFLGITKKSDVHLTNQCGVYEGTSAGQPVFITPEPQTAPWKGTLQNLHCGGIVLNLWVKPHLKTKHFPSQKWLGLFPFLFC